MEALMESEALSVHYDSLVSTKYVLDLASVADRFEEDDVGIVQTNQ
jgi:hypothetical protein